jgi:hypothetical protein
MMTTHVVQYSGGIGSWAATQRVIAEHGTTNLVLLVLDNPRVRSIRRGLGTAAHGGELARS